MYISKTRFINWTRCPMCFAMDLKHNPLDKVDIDAERERREEILDELNEGITTSSLGDEEVFDSEGRPELEALLPYYNQVEDQALRIAKKYFHGTFIADSRNIHNQRLFEYESHGHTYRCYVDIFNENEDEINIIEVKATTNSKFLFEVDKRGIKTGLYFTNVANGKRNGTTFPLFKKDGNIWRLNIADSLLTDDASKNYEQKKQSLLDRYSDIGKYPHDLSFQKYVIEHALRKVGDNRQINYYLAVLNSEYVFDGTTDSSGANLYNEINGQEIITFYDMKEITEMYSPIIKKEIAVLESFILSPHDTGKKVPVGKWCEWNNNTECTFFNHCYYSLRKVPDRNKANNYISFHGFKDGDIKDKYQLINEGYWKFDDVPKGWLKSENHLIQRDYYDNGKEYIDKDKMQFWLNQLEYPIYHFDFETFPCPLPRFCGENPYRQSVFEFSLHIEREPGICDKEKDNFIFLNNKNSDDERRNLVEAIISHFEFNNDGTLHGTMLAQNTGFEIGRLEELAILFPEYGDKLRAICNKSADLIHLLKTKEDFYKNDFGEERAKTINYYHKDLSGSYSIKKTLPVLVPALTYKGMDVGNGVQAYITYLNYDSPEPTLGIMRTKKERRDALSGYCQQDTWAMVEILRAVRKMINIKG